MGIFVQTSAPLTYDTPVYRSGSRLSAQHLASWPKVLTAANQIVIKFSFRAEASGHSSRNSVASVIAIKTILRSVSRRHIDKMRQFT